MCTASVCAQTGHCTASSAPASKRTGSPHQQTLVQPGIGGVCGKTSGVLSFRVIRLDIARIRALRVQNETDPANAASSRGGSPAAGAANYGWPWEHCTACTASEVPTPLPALPAVLRSSALRCGMQILSTSSLGRKCSMYVTPCFDRASQMPLFAQCCSRLLEF